jgi:hypothetical protein
VRCGRTKRVREQRRERARAIGSEVCRLSSRQSGRQRRADQYGPYGGVESSGIGHDSVAGVIEQARVCADQTQIVRNSLHNSQHRRQQGERQSCRRAGAAEQEERREGDCCVPASVSVCRTAKQR